MRTHHSLPYWAEERQSADTSRGKHEEVGSCVTAATVARESFNATFVKFLCNLFGRKGMSSQTSA